MIMSRGNCCAIVSGCSFVFGGILMFGFASATVLNSYVGAASRKYKPKRVTSRAALPEVV